MQQGGQGGKRSRVNGGQLVVGQRTNEILSCCHDKDIEQPEALTVFSQSADRKRRLETHVILDSRTGRCHVVVSGKALQVSNYLQSVQGHQTSQHGAPYFTQRVVGEIPGSSGQRGRAKKEWASGERLCTYR